MTTPAGIAPSANSFSISLARGGRSFSKTSTADLSSEVMSSPNDNSASSSMESARESATGGGSSFHAVLHHLYSSQNASSDSDGGDDTRDHGKDQKTKDASGLTAATMIFPLAEDGTQLRNRSWILRTFTASASNSNPQPTSETDDAPVDAPTNAVSPASDNVTETSPAVTALINSSNDRPAGENPPVIPATSAKPSDTKPAAQDAMGKSKFSFAPHAMEPAPAALAAKATATAKPQADINPSQADANATDETQSNDAERIQNPALIDPSTVDESDFNSVLSKVYLSQPEATEKSQTPGINTDSRVSEGRSSRETRVLPSAVKPQPTIAKDSVNSASAPDPQAPQGTPATADPTSFAAGVAPVAAEPPAVNEEAKPAESNARARVNASLPPFETRATAKVPAPSGEVAFAAKLTGSEASSEKQNTTPAPEVTDSIPQAAPLAEPVSAVSISASNNATISGRNAAPRQPSQFSNPATADVTDPKGQGKQVPSKAPPTASQPSSDAAAPADRGRPAPPAEPLIKAEANAAAPQPVIQSGSPTGSATAPKGEAAPPAPSPAARMEQVIEMPAAPQSSNRDITVRVPDATERGTDIRFLERGGEVRVMVRTSDSDMAQTLRGGLSDFVSRMEHTGIRTEVWRPGHDAPPSQGDSQHHAFEQKGDQRGDSRGSGYGRNQQGSQEQESSRQRADKPGWVEELETSLAQPTSPAIQ